MLGLELIIFNMYQFFDKGETSLNLQAGDVVLTHGSTWISILIRIGQAIRFQGDKQPYAYWNHAALVVNEQGDLIEALGYGITKRNISVYQPKEYAVIKVQACDDQRKAMVRYAEFQLGKKYGILTFLSLGLSLLTGLKFTFGIEGEMVCSGLVASALERADEVFPRPSLNMTPADLAVYFNVGLPKFINQVTVEAIIN